MQYCSALMITTKLERYSLIFKDFGKVWQGGITHAFKRNEIVKSYTFPISLLTHPRILFLNTKRNPANNLNIELKLIHKWAFQWKTSYDPEPTKKVQEAILSEKTTKKTRPKMFFNKFRSVKLILRNIWG